MPQIVDFMAYKEKKEALSQLKQGAVHLFPIIEDVVDTEIAMLTTSQEVFDMLKNDPQVNLSVVTSLCFALSKYLKKLIDQPNEFKINWENAPDFVKDLVCSMMIDTILEKKEM